jgi:hypothetical protein
MPTLIVSFTATAGALAAGLVAAAVVPLGAAALPAGRVATAAEPATVVAAGALVAAGAAVPPDVMGAAGFGVSVALLPPHAANTAATLPAAASFNISRRRNGRSALFPHASSNERIVFPFLLHIFFDFPPHYP